MPSQQDFSPWILYDTWFKKYGDIVHVKVFQQHIVLLGSFEAAQAMFDKNGALFSDRPYNVMLPLMGWDFNFATHNYTSRYRRHRKIFHEFFSPSAIQKYSYVQYREVESFLSRLERTPEDFLHHIRHTLAAIIMDITYGIRIQDQNDPYISIAKEAVSFLNLAGIAGSFIVDFFPFLRYLPAWAPGTSFKRVGAYAKKVVAQMVDQPFDYVKENITDQEVSSSVAGTLASRLLPSPGRDSEEEIFKNVAGVAYAAGADTTSSAVQSFFLAMVLFPEAQHRAQLELDNVVGLDRLPTLEDRNELPYTSALIKEVMRWQPVAPLGVPHSAPCDYTHKGYHIPKGAMILGIAWSILHDPTMYPDPERFYPERFLKEGKLDPKIRDPDAAFGYGRRICPGRHLSDANVFLIVASVLCRFDILPFLNNCGEPYEYQIKSTKGLFTYPIDFKCKIVPRDVCIG
ncbi:cytochrome P450 [Dendrothele bispora CBS 962.96]|uniref:Cytochrome P450 n=1 Tax=Dendrothele bispora (strain CBS 962.96) TaxID=1314807 RepID=A0A4S8MAH0_DENBC|nr:cytochrome P450 [Dendrothele bispora CBS 962.96]